MAPAEDAEHGAKEICLRLLAIRSRTRAELAEALRRKGTCESVAERVLGRLEEVGLVDDVEFAHAWVHSRHKHQGLARQALIAELRRKNVSDDIVRDAVSTVDLDAEEVRARELIQRQLGRATVHDRTKQIRRLVGMLARKGYPPGMAFRIVSQELEYIDEIDLFDDDAEEDELR